MFKLFEGKVSLFWVSAISEGKPKIEYQAEAKDLKNIHGLREN